MTRVTPPQVRDVWGLADYAALSARPAPASALERLAAPDGGAVDLAAEYVLVTATKENP